MCIRHGICVLYTSLFNLRFQMCRGDWLKKKVCFKERLIDGFFKVIELYGAQVCSEIKVD